MIDRTVPPCISDFSSLTIPDLCDTVLPSGIRLRYLDWPGLDVISIIVVFDSGICESDNVCASRLAVPLVSEGSVAHPDGELSELMGYNGVKVSTRQHDHHTEFSFSMLRSRLDDVVPLIREFIFSPAFSMRSVEVYRENAAQAYMLNRQKVGYRADMLMSRHLFGADHIKARELTDTDYMSVTRDDIVASYRQITGSEVTVYVVGAIDGSVKAQIDAVFADRDVLPDSRHNIVPYMACGLGRRYDVHMDEKLQSGVVMSLPVIDRNHPDYIMLRNLIIALGGYFGGRLMTNIREDKGLTYGISSALYGSPEGAYVSIVSKTDNRNVDALIDESRREVARLSDELFSDVELKTVRSYILSQLASMLDTPFSIMQYHLSLKTAFIPQPDYFVRQFDTALNMTSEQLRDIARRHLADRDWTVVVAGS